MTLSIVIPCYNEERTLGELLQQVVSVDLGDVEKEVIVVDDGSKDRSYSIAQSIAEKHPDMIRVFSQPKNCGKGAAIRRGFKEATGGLIVIQDADLEYDPQDFRQMLELFQLPGVDVVFGSRRLLANPVSSTLFYLGAYLINFLTNVFYGVRISDQFTCYKMFRRGLLDRISLRRNGFDIDAELTAKLLRLGKTVWEVPITYHPRSFAEGKKLQFRDGLPWIWQLVLHRFSNPRRW